MIIQQSIEDHLNWAHLEVKDGSSALKVNEREESIHVDLTEPIPPTSKNPKRKFSPVRTPEQVIPPNHCYFFSHVLTYTANVILIFSCAYKLTR